MSYISGLLVIILACVAIMVPGFLVARLLRFRSRTCGSVALSLGMVLIVSGWLAAFSVAGLVMLLCGLLLFGAGIEGMAQARKRT